MSRRCTRAEAGAPVRIPLNIQVRDGGRSEQVSSSVGGEKWSDCEHIFEVVI